MISVGIRNFNLEHSSHQMLLKNPTNITLEIYHAACRLFDETWPPGMPIRQLGIYTGRLKDASYPRQLELFDHMDYVRLEKLDQTVDEIRSRYGNDSLIRAVFVNQKEEKGNRKIDHMEGGVSREKRTVDYSKIKIV